MAKGLVTPKGGWRPLLRAALESFRTAGVGSERLWTDVEQQARAVRRASQLLELVVTWNARVDLTAARSPEELVDLYLADAFLLAIHADEPCGVNAPVWLDVGSGAGAPGLVFGVLRPDWALILVEPRAKRIAFLRSAVGHLGLDSVQVREGRSDAMAAACCDVAISRATFPPPEWLAEGARLSRGSVWVLLAKSDLPSLSEWSVRRQIDYAWPLSGVARRAVEFVRNQPRKPEEPSPAD